MRRRGGIRRANRVPESGLPDHAGIPLRQARPSNAIAEPYPTVHPNARGRNIARDVWAGGASNAACRSRCRLAMWRVPLRAGDVCGGGEALAMGGIRDPARVPAAPACGRTDALGPPGSDRRGSPRASCQRVAAGKGALSLAEAAGGLPEAALATRRAPAARNELRSRPPSGAAAGNTRP